MQTIKQAAAVEYDKLVTEMASRQRTTEDNVRKTLFAMKQRGEIGSVMCAAPMVSSV